jgi:RNAse (barnase) inhibitor barstar
MNTLSSLPAQAVVLLGSLRVPDLEREARQTGQRWLRADCADASDKAGVLNALGRGWRLPKHFGANLDALYDCITDLQPRPDTPQPGIVLVVEHLPDGPGFDAVQRDSLLEVFRDAADYFSDLDTAFRVLYSVSDSRPASS